MYPVLEGEMFEGFFGLLYFAVTAVVGVVAFGVAREFVRQRLRFVDVVRHPLAPWIAGLGVLLVAQPIAWLLPLVTATTAAVAGVAAGLGTASGVKALKRGD
ncbi:MAG: hypothetical protein SFU57_02080 [Gemmatimonadales bacterium]|nr:hypothetical protein [Gemmatimonadales bacterium]MDZ4259873.1 hypothetical protein [Gemmatimonadales bacterium]MDZ4390212.1 hypothetical protein [Gemmatimonadales bacterium]PKL93531.1 MAG: hypothetical protein CVV20_03185 [Gemmatimonadetes bacterium HGW-Gemmatimonadetes-1]